MTTLIVCLTVIFCVVWITLWIKHMVSQNLPMFTYARCEWNANTKVKEERSIGFSAEPVSEEKPAPTDKEKKEAVMQDPITLCASLLRGEVDIDDIES